jgi:hypothetical protein
MLSPASPFPSQRRTFRGKAIELTNEYSEVRGSLIPTNSLDAAADRINLHDTES